MHRKDIHEYFVTVWAALRRQPPPYCQADHHNVGGNPTLIPCPRRATDIVSHQASPGTWLVLHVCADHGRELAEHPSMLK